ncbi:MAG: hypothetical protein Q8N03_07365 [Ignavibacteria bacterium]|nr:hypothetical protein [Ignavibacteria bacterium]MDP3831990.1 hypothetical protein [Ignavibacteriaceae bacterium]
MKKENIFDNENHFPQVTQSLQKLSKTEVPYMFEEKLFAQISKSPEAVESFWDRVKNSFLWIPSTASITVASVIFLVLMVNERIVYTNPFSEMPRVRSDIFEVDRVNQTELAVINDEVIQKVKSGRTNSNRIVMNNELVGFKLISSSDEERKLIDSLKNSLVISAALTTERPE